MGKNSDPERWRDTIIAWSDLRLQDALNAGVSRHGRVEAVFDSIYARLTESARAAGRGEPVEHPSEQTILLGAVALNLDSEQVEKLVALRLAVVENRHMPGPHDVDLPYVLGIARKLAALVTR